MERIQDNIKLGRQVYITIGPPVFAGAISLTEYFFLGICVSIVVIAGLHFIPFYRSIRENRKAYFSVLVYLLVADCLGASIYFDILTLESVYLPFGICLALFSWILHKQIASDYFQPLSDTNCLYLNRSKQLDQLLNSYGKLIASFEDFEAEEKSTTEVTVFQESEGYFVSLEVSTSSGNKKYTNEFNDLENVLIFLDHNTSLQVSDFEKHA